MKIRIFIVFVFIMSTFAILKAQTQYFFYVQFSDKNNTTYSLQRPAEYLSTRAIERRISFHIAIDSTDLPVNQTYVNQIAALGIKVHSRSKWMNGVTVMLSDSGMMHLVRELNFVKFTQYTGKMTTTPASVIQKSQTQETGYIYGNAATQINQLNGTTLHNNGFRGQGIQIGILDAGFSNVDVNRGFDSLRLQGRLLGTKDIILPGNNVFREHTHGAQVLSTMAGNIDGQYIGTAPKASFWLIRTEYDPTEYLSETDFWVSGIEFADSAGVDVINSSLGYTTFNDPSMNFTYNDMNGKVSRASRAATMAAEKGIIVCNSAGNDGGKSWNYLGVPADADKIFTVGSVTSANTPSSFSSFGPSADQRIKPDVCAMGSLSCVIFPDGVISTNNGTSFSSPIMAGMLSCLLQRYKAFDPNPVMSVFYRAVIESCNNYATPTPQSGYGIPDFVVAESKLPIYDGVGKLLKTNENHAEIRQYPTGIQIKIREGNNTGMYNIRIYNSNGILIYSKNLNESMATISTSHFSPGVCVMMINLNGATQINKILIP